MRNKIKERKFWMKATREISAVRVLEEKGRCRGKRRGALYVELEL